MNASSSHSAVDCLALGTWTTLSLLESLDELTGKPADIRLRFISAEATLNIARREVVIGFRNSRAGACT